MTIQLESLLKTVLGSIDVNGSLSRDEQAKKNLDNYEQALAWLLRELVYCARWATDSREEERFFGQQAQMILVAECADQLDKSTAKAVIDALCDEYGFEKPTVKNKGDNNGN